MILKLLTVILLVAVGTYNLWLAGNMTYDSCQKLWLGYSSNNWPTVVGEIELSSVIKHPTSRGGVAFKPEVHYGYQVGQEFYTSNQIEFRMFGYSQKDANVIVSEFQKGKPALIHYQDGNPQMSSLTTGVQWDVFMGILFGLFWFLPSAFLFLLLDAVYKTPANEFMPGYIAELKRRFSWGRKSDIWKPPDRL